MKKLFVLLLALMMVFSLAACGNDSSDASRNDDQGGADIENIVKTAEKIDSITPEEYKAAMKDGSTFAEARARIIGGEHCEPNDILGIEYVRAIKKIGSTIFVINTDSADKKYEDYIKKKVEKMIKRSIELPIINKPINNKK